MTTNNGVLISFLITHYNRPLDLIKCVDAIRNINFESYEIIVSDDGSSVESIDLIKEIKIDKLILTERNQGLAANINKGLKLCNGEFIIYCQDDFHLKSKLKDVLWECISVLKGNRADMVRFNANYNFPKLFTLTKNIDLIPKFSFRNFLVNSFQYSDNPFMTTKGFYDRFGYYFENTSGDYGEAEFAIRIFKSSAKIGILKGQYVDYALESRSVMGREMRGNIFCFRNKLLKKTLRAIRLYLEMVFYDKNKRGLITYKNCRN